MHVFGLLSYILPFSYSENLFIQFFISYSNQNQKDQESCSSGAEVGCCKLLTEKCKYIAAVKQEDSSLNLFSKAGGELLPSAVCKEGSSQPCTTDFQGSNCT